jgi:hypothetical protein
MNGPVARWTAKRSFYLPPFRRQGLSTQPPGIFHLFQPLHAWVAGVISLAVLFRNAVIVIMVPAMTVVNMATAKAPAVFHHEIDQSANCQKP